MKKGRKRDFFEGQFYFDSKLSYWLYGIYGFMPKQLAALQRMKDEKKPDDIEITKARRMKFVVSHR